MRRCDGADQSRSRAPRGRRMLFAQLRAPRGRRMLFAQRRAPVKTSQYPCPNLSLALLTPSCPHSAGAATPFSLSAKATAPAAAVRHCRRHDRSSFSSREARPSSKKLRRLAFHLPKPSHEVIGRGRGRISRNPTSPAFRSAMAAEFQPRFFFAYSWS